MISLRMMKYLFLGSPFDEAPSDTVEEFFLGMIPGSVKAAARRKPTLKIRVIQKAILINMMLVSSVKSSTSSFFAQSSLLF